MTALPDIFTRVNTATLRSHALTETAVWTPSGGSPVEMPVHFWDRFSTPEKYKQRIETSAPVALVETTRVDGTEYGFTIARADLVEIREVTYRVRGIEPDGNGATLLILSQD